MHTTTKVSCAGSNNNEYGHKITDKTVYPSYVHTISMFVNIIKRNNSNIVFPSELSFLSALGTQPSLD